MCFYFPLPPPLNCLSVCSAADAAAADGGEERGDGEKYHTAQEGCCCLHLKRRSVRGGEIRPPVLQRPYARPEDRKNMLLVNAHFRSHTRKDGFFLLGELFFPEDGANECVLQVKLSVDSMVLG